MHSRVVGKASKAIRKEKIFNYQKKKKEKKLIRNFLEKWSFRLALFQKRLLVRELRSLISFPGIRTLFLHSDMSTKWVKTESTFSSLHSLYNHKKYRFS